MGEAQALEHTKVNGVRDGGGGALYAVLCFAALGCAALCCGEVDAVGLNKVCWPGLSTRRFCTCRRPSPHPLHCSKPSCTSRSPMLYNQEAFRQLLAHTQLPGETPEQAAARWRQVAVAAAPTQEQLETGRQAFETYCARMGKLSADSAAALAALHEVEQASRVAVGMCVRARGECQALRNAVLQRCRQAGSIPSSELPGLIHALLAHPCNSKPVCST